MFMRVFVIWDYLARLFPAILFGPENCFVFRICNWVGRCIHGRAIYFRAKKVVAEGGGFGSGFQSPAIGAPFASGIQVLRAEAGQWAVAIWGGRLGHILVLPWLTKSVSLVAPSRVFSVSLVRP